MKKPIIGIVMRSSQSEDGRSVQEVFEKVRLAIIQIGGEPLLLCPPNNVDCYKTKYNDFKELTSEEKESINFWLNMCDGLFMPGGIKYLPSDFYIFEQALNKNIPILGVCLGMQMMSNYKKDFNIQIIDSSLNHDRLDLKYCHKIKIKKTSILYKILQKEEIEVNSFHKRQAFSNPLFNSIAYSEDDVLEAIEMKNKNFVLGVQWHPEAMLNYDINSQRIMNYFIEQAIKYKKSHDKGRLVKI